MRPAAETQSSGELRNLEAGNIMTEGFVELPGLLPLDLLGELQEGLAAARAASHRSMLCSHSFGSRQMRRHFASRRSVNFSTSRAPSMPAADVHKSRRRRRAASQVKKTTRRCSSSASLGVPMGARTVFLCGATSA